MNWSADDNEEYYAETKKPKKNPVFDGETLSDDLNDLVLSVVKAGGELNQGQIVNFVELIDKERRKFAVSQLENLKRCSFTTPTDDLPMVYVQDIQHQITYLTIEV